MALPEDDATADRSKIFTQHSPDDPKASKETERAPSGHTPRGVSPLKCTGRKTHLDGNYETKITYSHPSEYLGDVVNILRDIYRLLSDSDQIGGLPCCGHGLGVKYLRLVSRRLGKCS